MQKAGVLLAIATKAKTRAAMQLHTRLALSARGLPGERSHPAKSAVTLLAREAWQAACHELAADLPWTLRRANLLVEGVDLVGSVGRRLQLGELLLEISEETEPCRVMDALHPGLRAALVPDWRGGASCRVITPAEIQVGAAVRFTD